MKPINFRNAERDEQFKKEEAAALEKLKRRCTRLDTNNNIATEKQLSNPPIWEKEDKRCE